jgi:alpha-glucosidase (family GH31 glycosyl hydrolase)
MLAEIVAAERRLVTIVDPHVKFDEEYFVYKSAKARGILVQDLNKDP